MANRRLIEDAVRTAYAARIRGDLEALLDAFADDVHFEINGRGTNVASMLAPARGKAALRSAMQELINGFRFEDWQEIALLVDEEKAALHWRAKVIFLPSGKTATFDVFDFITFRDGKIVDFRQSTDTAQIVSMISGLSA